MKEFGGSYFGFLEAFQKRHRGRGTAFDLAQMVTDAFPSFRDEQWLNGQRSACPLPFLYLNGMFFYMLDPC